MGELRTLGLNPDPELSALEFKLLNDFQRDFPLVSHPFAELACRLGVDEARVMEVLKSLQLRGLVSRIGAVFRPNVVGVSALAALAVPVERLDEVAARVSAYSEVNHNYQREHGFNLWFVVTCSSAAQLAAIFQAIESACDSGPVLVLPLLEQFHIDLGFSLAPLTQPYRQAHHTDRNSVAVVELSPSERALMAVLQIGLPLVSQPFSALGWAEADALALMIRWTDTGVIKRFGVVVRHHELGFTANAMVVWNVPDGLVSAVGQCVAASQRVSLCYQRPRVLPHWPYNLFCMMHGKDRADVEQRIVNLAKSCCLGDYPHDILFSCRRFKQCGARYVDTVRDEKTLELACGSD